MTSFVFDILSQRNNKNDNGEATVNTNNSEWFWMKSKNQDVLPKTFSLKTNKQNRHVESTYFSTEYSHRQLSFVRKNVMCF